METTNKLTLHEDLSQADVNVSTKYCKKDTILDQVEKYAQANQIDVAMILNTHCCLVYVTEYLMHDGSRESTASYHIIPVWTDKQTVDTLFSHYQETNKYKVLNNFNSGLIQSINSYPLLISFNNSTIGYPAHQKYLEAFNTMLNHYGDFIIRRTNGAFTIR